MCIFLTFCLTFLLCRLTVPNSDLALSLGNVASLRPPSDAQGTRLYILENTPENQVAIKSGRIVPPPEAPTTTTPDPPKKSFSAGESVISMNTVRQLIIYGRGEY